MKKHMNQRKLSTLWSSLFAVMMMLVGSNAVAQINVYTAAGTFQTSYLTCDNTTLQNAIGATELNGEVRILGATCNITAPINISNSFKLTSGVGGTVLTLGAAGVLNVTSGTVTVATGVNNFDIVLNGAGAALNIGGAPNAGSIILNGAGNTIEVTNGTLTNDGSIVTSLSPRVAGTGNILGSLNSNSANAPAGVYYNGGVLAGTGTWGNLFFTTGSVVGAATTYAMQNDAEVVVRAALNLNASVSFTNAGNNIDFQHTNGLINGVGGISVQGNYYVTGAGGATDPNALYTGALSVEKDANFGNTNSGYAYVANTVTVKGNLTVGATSFGAASAPTATVWGDVSILDDDFNPALTLSQSGATSSTTLAATTAVTPLTSLTIAAGKTVATATAITTTTMTNSGTLNHSAGAFTATTLASNAGTVNLTGGTFASTTVTSNAGSINNSAGTLTLGTVTANPGTIATSGTGATSITTLTSNAGTVSNSGASVGITTVTANGGTISNAVGATTITNFATNAGTVSASGGTLTIFAPNSLTVHTNNGTLSRTGGTFIINGALTNGVSGAITNASTNFGGGTYATRLTNAVTDGIQVFGNFIGNNVNGYTGQVIVDATTATRTVTGTHGNLGIRSGASMVTAGGNLIVTQSLVLHSGTFNLAAFNVDMTSTVAGAVLGGDTDATPGHGIMMAANTQWTNGTVTKTGNATAPLGFFQVAAGVPAGSLFVNVGQVQLLSNVHVSNITVVAGATVRKPFNAFCYDLVVAGTSTISGAILECGVFTITNNATSIRAQLIAAGYDPDNMNQSIQIAIGAGNTIQLTDAGAEGIATPANWLGVTIVNTQSRFILSSGIVNLNQADLTLRGAFVYAGDWNNATPGNRARITADAVQSAVPADTDQGGWLVFSGLNQPNADFIFVADGVNSTVDGFVLRRLRFNRTGTSPIRIVDNNNVNAGNVPSSVVVSEKLEVNGVLQVGDNNIKWIGGNNTGYSASTLARRSIQLNTSEMVGSGFFWLANNHISALDANTINVNAVANTTLKMQLLADGDAGQRDYNVATTNQLTNIVSIGNGGMNYVRRGWLKTNQLATVDGDFTLGLDQGFDTISLANLEVTSGLTFTGNLFILDNNSTIGGNPKLGTTARMILTAGAADRVTTVKGIFQTAASGAVSGTAGGYVQTGVNNDGRTHNLVLENRVRFGADNQAARTPNFIVARPSRVVFASGSNRTLEYVNGVATVRIHRVQFNAGAATTEYTLNGGNTLQVNDLLLTNGLFRTNGGLAMVDLASTDPSWVAASTNNLSIVTRDRSGSTHGQITRGLGSFGAYTQFAYAAGGGAPYTVQHIGNQSRFTGDEVPGLNVTNASANANNSVLNRLVIDVATGTEFELAKDLIVLTRIEALTGTVDVVASAFLDIAPNVQWVHGHAVLTDVAAGVIRFPNVAGNTATGAVAGNGSTSSRYDLLYVSKVNHTTGYEYKSGVGVRDLTVITAGTAASPVTLTLSENKEASGSVRVVDGVLNLDSKTLKISGNVIVDGQHNGNLASTGVNNNGNGMVSGWFPGRAGAETPVLNPYNYGVGTYDNGYGRIVDTNGTLEMTGTTSNYILGYVQANNKQVSLPNILVTKTGSGAVIFDIDQTFTSTPDEDINRFNVLSFTQNTGTTHLRPGATLDRLPGTITTSDAPNSGATGAERPSSGNADFAPKRIQHWFVRQNMTLVSGNFFSWGATMTVDGNYLQGNTTSLAVLSAVFFGGQNGLPLNGAFQWNGNTSLTTLKKQVNGNFTVLNDQAANTAKATDDNVAVHRYYLSNGWLGVAGNYAFDGHADVTSGIGIPVSSRGFVGTIEFNRAVSFPETAALQSVRHVQHFRAFFDNVTVNGRGITLAGQSTDHMWVSDHGVFTFALGNVVTGPTRELILQNPSVDMWQANNIISGAVRLSGSNSFVEGNLRRYMSFGGTTGGLVQDGYIFPLGQTFTANNAPAFSGTNSAKRFYRPMTLQFPANLGLTINAVATSMTDASKMIDPSLKVQGRSGTAQNPGSFYTVDLTTTSDMYWNVKFNQLPALEPNIRLGVQGLLGNQNSNIDDMRIVTPGATQSGWRMAGVYDLTVGGPDDTFNPNDFIDGMPTFIQEGPGLLAQQYNPAIGVDLRVATNALSNPFDGPGTIAYLQVIHNSPAGAVDVLINGIKVLDDFTYQSATPFIALAAETAYNIAIQTANNATTLLTINGAVLNADQSYILIAQGGNNGKAFDVKVVDNARRASTVSNGMQFFFSHGVTNGPSVNVERVTTSTPRTLEQLIAVNAAYGTTTSYMTQLNPSISTLQLKAGGLVVGQYLFDFGNYTGGSMTLLASGAVGGAGANALTIIGVDAAGNVVRPAVSTSDDDNVATELPAEFTLNGNFPNPFNPTTNISFDLPEQANVRVEIVDLLGRQVMTVAPQSMSAGANKVITVDAARLSSGVYFYRVIAEGSTKTFVQGSKFTLVK